uniref:Putative peritrophin n=1 Tax=Amblyomma aureolatum TaxID=187763 RepID=A0A1E1X1Y7_9ACAR
MAYLQFLLAVFVMTCVVAMTSAASFAAAPASPGAYVAFGSAPPGSSGAGGAPPASPGAGGAPPAGAPAEESCPETDGMVPLYVPDPDDCTKYTVCSGGFGMKLDCPPGLHFNKVTNHCDFPPLAQCEESA